jgi:hypothetical protein
MNMMRFSSLKTAWENGHFSCLRIKRVLQLTWQNCIILSFGAFLEPRKRLPQIEVHSSLQNSRKNCRSLLKSHYNGL